MYQSVPAVNTQAGLKASVTTEMFLQPMLSISARIPYLQQFQSERPQICYIKI